MGSKEFKGFQYQLAFPNSIFCLAVSLEGQRLMLNHHDIGGPRWFWTSGILRGCPGRWFLFSGSQCPCLYNRDFGLCDGQCSFQAYTTYLSLSLFPGHVSGHLTPQGSMIYICNSGQLLKQVWRIKMPIKQNIHVVTNPDTTDEK